VKAELEKEHGRVVYSFDLKVPSKPGIEEVQVDASSGKVVSVEHEDEPAEAWVGVATPSYPAPTGRSASGGPKHSSISAVIAWIT
jgi:hypothetical protein